MVRKRKAEGQTSAAKRPRRAVKATEVPVTNNPFDDESDNGYSGASPVGSQAAATAEKRRTRKSNFVTERDPDDPLYVNYTQDGKPRAIAEAERDWRYVCATCGRRFNRPCRLATHELDHTGENPYACEFKGCTFTTKRTDKLKRHMATHTGGVAKNFKCTWEGCTKTFSTNQHLRGHITVHENQERFRCRGYPPCSKPFRKQSTLDAHIKKDHLSQKAYPCTRIDEETGVVCTKGYDQTYQLRTHIAQAHEGSGGHRCNLCLPGESRDEDQSSLPISEPVTYRTRKDLRAHIAEAHPPVCPKCNKRFASRQTLQSHYELRHETPEGGLLMWKCGCGSLFTRRNNLIVHVRTVHLDLRRFGCSTFDLSSSNVKEVREWDRSNACDYAATVKATLEGHILTQHLGLPLNHKIKNDPRKWRPKQSLVAQLTGYRGPEADIQYRLCTMPECEHYFNHDDVWRKHLADAHELDDDEIEEMFMERQIADELQFEKEALEGGEFWIGGLPDRELDFEVDWHANNAAHVHDKSQSSGGFATLHHLNSRPTLHNYMDSPSSYDTPYDTSIDTPSGVSGELASTELSGQVDCVDTSTSISMAQADFYGFDRLGPGKLIKTEDSVDEDFAGISHTIVDGIALNSNTFLEHQGL